MSKICKFNPSDECRCGKCDFCTEKELIKTLKNLRSSIEEVTQKLKANEEGKPDIRFVDSKSAKKSRQLGSSWDGLKDQFYQLINALKEQDALSPISATSVNNLLIPNAFKQLLIGGLQNPSILMELRNLFTTVSTEEKHQVLVGLQKLLGHHTNPTPTPADDPRAIKVTEIKTYLEANFPKGFEPAYLNAVKEYVPNADPQVLDYISAPTSTQVNRPAYAQLKAYMLQYYGLELMNRYEEAFKKAKVSPAPGPTPGPNGPYDPTIEPKKQEIAINILKLCSVYEYRSGFDIQKAIAPSWNIIDLKTSQGDLNALANAFSMPVHARESTYPNFPDMLVNTFGNELDSISQILDKLERNLQNTRANSVTYVFTNDFSNQHFDPNNPDKKIDLSFITESKPGFPSTPLKNYAFIPHSIDYVLSQNIALNVQQLKDTLANNIPNNKTPFKEFMDLWNALADGNCRIHYVNYFFEGDIFDGHYVPRQLKTFSDAEKEEARGRVIQTFHKYPNKFDPQRVSYTAGVFANGEYDEFRRIMLEEFDYGVIKELLGPEGLLYQFAAGSDSAPIAPPNSNNSPSQPVTPSNPDIEKKKKDIATQILQIANEYEFRGGFDIANMFVAPSGENLWTSNKLNLSLDSEAALDRAFSIPVDHREAQYPNFLDTFVHAFGNETDSLELMLTNMQLMIKINRTEYLLFMFMNDFSHQSYAPSKPLDLSFMKAVSRSAPLPDTIQHLLSSGNACHYGEIQNALVRSDFAQLMTLWLGLKTAHTRIYYIENFMDQNFSPIPDNEYTQASQIIMKVLEQDHTASSTPDNRNGAVQVICYNDFVGFNRFFFKTFSAETINNLFAPDSELFEFCSRFKK